MTLKIGIDVGGTFTDFVVASDGQAPRIYKTLPPRLIHRSPWSKVWR